VAKLTITLNRPAYSYAIHIASKLLTDQAAALIQAALPNRKKLLLVTHERLWALFSPQLNLRGFDVTVHTVPEGETTKSVTYLQGIWHAAQAAGLTRQDAFVALGGGVIGDLTGFAASSYYRGVPFVQIPTTLLAQVDSSVGGKTGINVGPVKNSIGAFYQPALVLIDPTVLTTLPDRELTAGLAEVLKYGLIETSCTQQQAALWSQLAAYPDRQSLMSDIGDIIQACCAIKAAVVQQDETEQLGLRALLNLGHTFGHALEADGQYNTYLHGEAVAIGTLWACRFAVQEGLLTSDALQQVDMAWKRLRMPVTPFMRHNPEQLLARMRQDKKNDTTDVITLVLPNNLPQNVSPQGLGQVSVRKDISAHAILAFLTNAVSA
jgi:3-dehydroquinate synthase